MTNEEMKNWIDNANYYQLLDKWRNAPAGSIWFQGEIGDYYDKVMKETRSKTSPEDQVSASKHIGW